MCAAIKEDEVRELLEEVSQFQSQVLNFMITMVDDTQEIISDEIQAYKVYDVWVTNWTPTI